MEPEKEVQVNGLAPIVGWSNVTPSLKTTPSKTPDGNQYNNNNNVIKNVVAEKQTLLPSDVTFADKVKFVATEKDSIMSSSSSSRSSSRSSSMCRENKKPAPKIPDGGWGWIVVASSLIISMIADGISFSFGLLYTEFLFEYQETKSKTAWIGSLFMAVPLLSGPVMSALVDKYGCRSMTILGGLISGTGFVLSYMSNSIEMQFLNFGIIAGLGLGLCYVTAVVSIAFWFDKRRALATSLGACGTGIGTFVYAPMTQYFIDEYGWRGAVLLLAGTFFNMCVCGALMRDPDWMIEDQGKLQGKNASMRNASSTASISGSRSVGGESTFPGIEEIRKLMKSGESPEYILTTLATSMAVEPEPPPREEGSETAHKYRSVVNLPTFVKQSEKVPIEVLETLSSNKRLYNVILENYPALLLCRSTSDRGLAAIAESVAPTRVPVTMSMRLKQSKSARKASEATTNIEAPLLSPPTINSIKIVKTRQQSLPQNESWLTKHFAHNPPKHYMQNLKVHRNSVMYRNTLLNINKYRLRASSCPDIYRNSMITLAKDVEEKWYTEWVDLLKGIMDFSMFLEWHFFCLSVSTILLFTWFIVPYFYIAEHLNNHGYTQNQASQLISLIGIANAIGMVALGWAGDQPWMHVQKTFACCLLLCGLATCGMPLFTNQPIYLIATSILFGLTFASSFSFTPVVLVQLIPLDRFTTGYGLILLCQGIGNLCGPPVAGLISDITGDWEASFYVAGAWIFVSALFIALIPMTNNRIMIGKGELVKDMDRVSMA